MLCNVVATFHFANKTWIFISSILTARRSIATLALASLTSGVTTKKVWYTYQKSNCDMMYLRSSTKLIRLYWFMNCIGTDFFPLQTIIPAILTPPGRMRLSIWRNLQFRHVFMVLHTSTTVSPQSLLAMSIMISLKKQLICGHCFLARRIID